MGGYHTTAEHDRGPCNRGPDHLLPKIPLALALALAVFSAATATPDSSPGPATTRGTAPPRGRKCV
jgi:hypothetical protein